MTSASLSNRTSTYLFNHPRLVLLLLLLPPLLWLGIIYLGSLFSLLAHSFFAIDDFTGKIVYDISLDNFVRLFSDANRAIILRTVLMASVVTIICGIMAFPLAYYVARYASGRVKALFYIAVMLPLWSNYLVRVYSWKLILAKEGVIHWLFEALGLGWLLNWILTLPVVAGSSLSTSYIGTALTFTYIWLPFMVLPIQASLERVPRSLLEASSDLGARPGETFRKVIFPLAVPGIAAGSIFTFSLTLGDYIIPQLIGSSRPFIGQAVYQLQGTAGDIPMAAAFAMVPILIMAIYLTIAKRMGAFDAL
ncbi:putative spermidine/putrescine transport system permease protein [Dongia mobilis]|uniref:Putative spermidine/putrescine transport system permease protein n=1 Tax=Dongia mobilis TaxID=578943 RepID=A0A4R6WG19_9PROT|nr:ABC transporter permease [Dongia mobilis]TDQ78970.1 putative spermidine/putrescine transport system permease protein [Dongia mobilis]